VQPPLLVVVKHCVSEIQSCFELTTSLAVYNSLRKGKSGPIGQTRAFRSTDFWNKFSFQDFTSKSYGFQKCSYPAITGKIFPSASIATPELPAIDGIAPPPADVSAGRPPRDAQARKRVFCKLIIPHRRAPQHLHGISPCTLNALFTNNNSRTLLFLVPR
jgi:hypothetical protein